MANTYSNTLRLSRFAGLACAVVLVTGCATSPAPQSDASFGDAVRAARMTQTINPNASANRDMVKGLDGNSAVSAMDNYQKMFTTPQSTFNVNSDSNN